MTADGFIAKNQSHLADWTSKEDKKRFIEITKRAGVMIMGLNTWHTFGGKALKNRLNIVYTPTPIPQVEGMETTNLPPEQLLKDLEKRGFKEIAICGGTTIYTMFIKTGLVNKIYLTIEPILFGDGMKIFKEDIDVKLKLINCEKTENGTLLLEYDVVPKI
jgi:dihydrofolate reductase